MKEKVRVFIGSSSEGLEIARALQVELSSHSETTVWDQGIFELSKSNLANLVEMVSSFDFAVLVATPDDRLYSRGEEHLIARDNVMFEAGLFAGSLGIGRTFFVVPSNVDLKLPTDLLGISVAKYEPARSDANLQAAVAPAVFAIVKAMKAISEKIGRVKDRNLTHAGAFCFTKAHDGIRYLLVSSTEGRCIFPKGDIKAWEDNPIQAALRIAKKEAGVRGRIVEKVSKPVNYYNEELSTVNKIETFLLDVSKTVKLSYAFRRPKWYSLEEAISALTKGRDYNTSFELTYAIEWAEKEILRYSKSTVK